MGDSQTYEPLHSDKLDQPTKHLRTQSIQMSYDVLIDRGITGKGNDGQRRGTRIKSALRLEAAGRRQDAPYHLWGDQRADTVRQA